MGNFFIKRPIFAISLAITIVLMGGIAVLNLAVEQYPDITPPVVEVSATYYGANAETVNNTVATPIAQSIMGVSDMMYMQTTSANDGTMSLQALFDLDSEADIDAILTQNMLSSASSSLPESVVEQGVITRKINPSFLMVYALSSDGTFDASFLSNYAYINLQNELLKINGVSKVTIMGSGEYAMRIWVDPLSMQSYGITLEQIIATVESQSQLYAAGKIGAGPSISANELTYTLTLQPQIDTAEEFGEIILRSTDESVVYLKDIATINLGSQSYDVKSTLGESPAAIIMIYQTPGSNAVEVGARVRESIATLSERLPEGVVCQNIVDSTSSVVAGIRDIFKTLLLALLLVIAIIYLFLQSWRATLIPLIAIPVSLIGAFILFPVMGFSINIISLLGLVLAIGLVVDDAIVVVEAIEVNIAKGLSPRKAATEAMRNVSSPIIATTVVLLAVFIPVSLTGGVAGKLYQQFAAIISLSVIISAFNALTLSPALGAMLLKKREGEQGRFFRWFNTLFDRFIGRYTRSISALSRHLMRTAIFVGVLIAAIVALWQHIPEGFLPEEDQGYFMVIVETPATTSLEATFEAMEQIDRLIAKVPQVELTSFAAGFNMLAGVSMPNSGVIFVKLVDYSKRKLTAAQIAERLNEDIYMEIMSASCYAFVPPAIPGLGMIAGVTFEVQDLEGRGEEYLYAQTSAVMDSLRSNPLVSSVTTQYRHGVPQREIIVDRDHAMALGVDIEELYDMIGAMYGGSYINTFNRFGRLYQTYVQAAPSARADEASLENFYITNSDGEQVSLTAFAKIVESTGVEYVSQFNLYRSIGLTVMPSARASSNQIMEYIEGEMSEALPSDIGIAWSGVSYQESEASKGGNLIYMLILAFVFLVLAALYNSWGLPLSILMSLPIAVVGALSFIAVAHIFSSHYVVDVYMQISLIMLIALAAKNAILVVEYADKMFFDEGLSLEESARQAASLRVRPIIMTAFAFVLGVLPLVFASGVYSTARNIIGVALVGGMTVATAVGIYLYPTLYYMVAKIANFDKLRERRRSEDEKDN